MCPCVPLQPRLVSETARVDLRFFEVHLHYTALQVSSDQPRWAHDFNVIDPVVVGTYTRYQLSIAWVQTLPASTILQQAVVIWSPQEATKALVMRTSASQDADCSVTLR